MIIESETSVRQSNATQLPTRLIDAAHQFEAMLLQEMLRPMRNSEDSWDVKDKDQDPSADTLSSFGTEAVAKAISKSGGFGIARRVIFQMGQEHEELKKIEY